MSKKDFKQGMVAGAKPFGDKLDQLANVTDKAISDLKTGVDGVNSVVNCIFDDLSVQEKKNIYDLDTPQGLAELDQTEKEYLLSVLFTIADSKGSINDNQKFYLRALKTYLEVINVQVGIDLSTIENIDSVPFQKTIMQTVMEFLYLEYESHEYMDDYEEYFDLFSVNRKGVKELQGMIDHMVSLLGIEGLACHYSPLAEPEVVEEDIFEEAVVEEVADTEGKATDILLDGDAFEKVVIEGDTSGKKVFATIAYKTINENATYERKHVTINGRVQLKGKWKFRSCTIKAEGGTIWLPDNISFDDCDIYVGSEFIKAHDNAVINNCRIFGDKSYTINKSQNTWGESLANTISLTNGVVDNTMFEHIHGKIEINRIYRCRFENCHTIEGSDISSNQHAEIVECIFTSCDTVSVESSLLKNCKIKNVRSINVGEKTISGCTIEDCTVTDYEESLIADMMDAGASVVNCTFNNITMTEDSYLMSVYSSCTISNCTYNNCSTDRRDGKLIKYEK